MAAVELRPPVVMEKEPSTPNSIAPKVVKESSAKKPRRCLDFSGNSCVPLNLNWRDIEFQKLWPILVRMGWRSIESQGSSEGVKVMVMPTYSEEEARMDYEKFDNECDLVKFLCSKRETHFHAIFEEYFKKYPGAGFRPIPTLRAEDLVFNKLWRFLKKAKWRCIPGGLLYPYLYCDPSVTNKADATSHIERKSTKVFTSSGNLTKHIIENQEKFAPILQQYFDRFPITKTRRPESDHDENDYEQDGEDVQSSDRDSTFQDIGSYKRMLADAEFVSSDDEETESVSPTRSESTRHHQRKPINIARKRTAVSPPSQDDDERLSPPKRPKINVPPNLLERVKAMDASKVFNAIWPVLKKEHHWTHSVGNELHAFSFMKPPLKSKKDGVEGEDYFIGEAALIEYACRAFPELFEEEFPELFEDEEEEHDDIIVQEPEPKCRYNERQRSRKSDERKKDRNHVRNHQTQQRLSNSTALTVHATSKPEMRDTFLPFKIVYQRMKSMGWTHRRAPNKLKDYCYLAPDVKYVKDGKLGENMFDSEDDLVRHYHEHIHPIWEERNDQSDHSQSEDEEEEEEEEQSEESNEDMSHSMCREESESEADESEVEDDDSQRKAHLSKRDLSTHQSKSKQKQKHQSQQLAHMKRGKHSSRGGVHDDQESKRAKRKLFEESAMLCGFSTSRKVSRQRTRGFSSADERAEDGPDDSTTTELAFNTIWPTLLELGWKYFSGSGLASFYYAMPHVANKSSGRLGVDLFDSEQAVEEAYRKMKPKIMEQLKQLSIEASESEKEPSKMTSQKSLEKGSSNLTPQDRELGHFVWNTLESRDGWSLHRIGRTLCFMKPPINKPTKGIRGENVFFGYAELIRFAEEKLPDLVEKFKSKGTVSSSSEPSTKPTGISSVSSSHDVSVKPPRNSMNNETLARSSSVNSSTSIVKPIFEPQTSAGKQSSKNKLADFLRDKLIESGSGWVPALVKFSDDGTVEELITERDTLVDYVSKKHSNFYVEYMDEEENHKEIN